MGVHIAVYRLTKKIVGNYNDGHRVTGDYNEFDSTRYYGDKEFINENIFEPIDKEFPEYVRPLHFGRTKDWVKEATNIPDYSKERFLNILDEMENDPMIFFKFCY